MLLKLKIADLEAQNRKLEEDKLQLQETIHRLNLDIEVLTNQNRTLKDSSNRLLQSLIKKSRDNVEKVYIVTSPVNENSFELSTTPENPDDSEVSEEQVLQILREKLSSTIEDYETMKRELRTSLIMNRETISDELIGGFETIIEALDNSINQFKAMEINSLEQGIEYLSDKGDSDSKLNQMHIQLNNLLLDELAHKKELIAQKEVELANQFEKAKSFVAMSIRAAKEQMKYMNNLKDYVGNYITKDYSYTTEEMAASLKSEANSIMNYISDYLEDLATATLESKKSYDSAIKSENIDDFIVIDIDKFGKTNTSLQERTQKLYDRDFALLYEKYKEINTKNGILETEIFNLKQEIDYKNAEIERVNQNLNTLESMNVALSTELEANKIEFKDTLRDTIISTINSLDEVIAQIQADENEHNSDLIQPLEDQKALLSATLEKYTQDNFVEQYKPVIETALEMISITLKEYRETKLLPLQREFQNHLLFQMKKNSKRDFMQ